MCVARSRPSASAGSVCAGVPARQSSWVCLAGDSVGQTDKKHLQPCRCQAPGLHILASSQDGALRPNCCGRHGCDGHGNGPARGVVPSVQLLKMGLMAIRLIGAGMLPSLTLRCPGLLLSPQAVASHTLNIYRAWSSDPAGRYSDGLRADISHHCGILHDFLGIRDATRRPSVSTVSIVWLCGQQGPRCSLHMRRLRCVAYWHAWYSIHNFCGPVCEHGVKINLARLKEAVAQYCL